MKNILFLFLFFGFSQTATAQIGISAAYSNVGTNFEFHNDFKGFNPSMSFGVDYWFRLKNYRVEFYPQLSFLQSSTETYLNKFQETEELSQSLQMIGGKLNTRFYIFDIEGDCDCPTWSKDGDVFKKGFFLLATGGVHNLTQTSGRATGESTVSDVAFTYGGGIGLDIGLSEYLTLSPFVTYELTNSTTWSLHPCDFCGQVADESKLTPLTAGLHLQYRWKKY